MYTGLPSEFMHRIYRSTMHLTLPEEKVEPNNCVTCVYIFNFQH